MERDGTTLWERWVSARDEAAFETLVRPALPATYHLARRLGLGHADAQDVVQEALADLARTRSARPGAVGIAAWLLRTVRLRSLMNRRAARRRSRRQGRAARRPRPVAAERAPLDVEEEVERALGLLSEDDRQVLVLRYLYDLAYREISFVLGISENACRVRVHRASERLRQRLGAKAPALLAAVPLPAFRDAARAIATATKGAAGASASATGGGLLGGILVHTGLKMAAAAAAASLLTAGAFLVWEPASPSGGAAEPEVVARGAPAVRAEAAAGGARPPAAARGAAAGGTPPAPGLPLLHGREGLGGRGVITGQVRTADGKGLPGVVVVATPRVSARLSQQRRSEPGEPPPPPDVDEAVRRAAQAAFLRATGTRRATTDVRGAYRLEGLADTRHFLRAYARGYDLRPAPGAEAGEARPGGTVDFVATAVVRLRVLVSGADPALAGPQARVGILAEQDPEALDRAGARWWSPDQDTLTLRPGTWWLQAVQGPDREMASEPTEVDLDAGVTPEPITLALVARPGLHGHVEIAGGLRARSMDVYALPLAAGASPPRPWRPRTTSDAVRARTGGDDGTYAFPNLPPGRYLVGATLGGAEALDAQVVEVADRMREHVIRIGPEALGPYVTVSVLDPDGKPVDERLLDFMTSFDGEHVHSMGGGLIMRREDGAWVVAERLPSGGAGTGGPGIHRLAVTHRRLGTKWITYDPAAHPDVQVRFAQPGSLTVRLEGLQGRPLDGHIALRLYDRLDPDSISSSSVRADVRGHVGRFPRLQPGAYRLVLVPLQAGLTMMDAKTISVGAGANALTWAVPAVHTLRVEPPEGARGLYLGLRRLHPDGDWMQQYASARRPGAPVVFRFLPPGRYEVVGSLGGRRLRIPVSIPGDGVVRLE